MSTTNRDMPGELLAKLRDRSKYKVVESVPYFDQHLEARNVVGPDGKPQCVNEDFDKAKLEVYARNNNQRAAAGMPTPLSLGHSKDVAPEEEQPRIVGHAVNYRVIYSQALGRYVIVADEYYDPKDFERFEVASYPYRSIERVPSTQTFQQTALLRRAPARPLGSVCYKRGEAVVRYSMACFAATQPERTTPVNANPFATLYAGHLTAVQRRDGQKAADPHRISQNLMEAALRYSAAHHCAFGDGLAAVRSGEEVPLTYAANAPTARYQTYVDLGFRQDRVERYASMTGPQGSYGPMPDAEGDEQQPLEMPQQQPGVRPAQYAKQMKAYAMRMKKERGIPEHVTYAAAAACQNGEAPDGETALQQIMTKHENEQRYAKANPYTR